MKKKLFALAFVIFLLGGCSNQKLAEMKTFEGNGYIGIEWEGRKYVPYSVLDYRGNGSLLGYLDGDKKEEIYAFENYSSEEWVVDHSKYDGTFMLYREVNVKENTLGITSEYEWNN